MSFLLIKDLHIRRLNNSQYFSANGNPNISDLTDQLLESLIFEIVSHISGWTTYAIQR